MSLILILCLIILIAYLLHKHQFTYWTRRNVHQIEPSFLFGNIGRQLRLKTSMPEILAEFYNEHKEEKFIGTYLSYKPMLLIMDPVLISHILIKDFNVFHDRPTPGEAAKNYPLVGNLVNLKGQNWRDLRVKLSPTFTSGKIKAMIPIMRENGKILEDYFLRNIKNGVKTFDVKDMMARLTISNISSMAFGVENDCINEPDNVFKKTGMKIFSPSLRNGIKNILMFFTPGLFEKIKYNPNSPEVEKFVYSLINSTIEFREKNNFQRNDFMQLMIELKNKGFVTADKNYKESDDKEFENEKPNLRKLTIDEIAAQVFIFFGAGYETSSSTMTYCLYELCKNKNAQRKCQEEIAEVAKSAGPDGITYEVLEKMKYLDACIDETLRKYPILAFLFRIASKDYQIPGTDVVLEKNTPVFIPLLGVQRDPDIFENPLSFIPERFLNSLNGNAKVPGTVYAPFGDGPRKCIAGRLGKLQSKLGLAMILQKFSFELSDQSLENKELTFHPAALPLSAKENIDMIVTLRS